MRIKSLSLPTYEEKEELAGEFRSALGVDYEVDINTAVSSTMDVVKEIFDIVIFHKKEVIAALNYREQIASMRFSLNQNADTEQKRFEKVGIKCGIMYFGEKNKFYICCKGKTGFQVLDFNNLIIAIVGERNFGERPLIDNLAAEVLGCKPEEYNDKLSIGQLKELDRLFSDESIDFDDINGVISFRTKNEDAFFKLLLSHSNCKSICRYTSLESFYLMLRDCKQAMCSITCMNDKGEISYTDKSIGFSAYAESHSAIVENNNCFILSCCNKKKFDDLTMWRLYGDDAKGACLEYDINNKLIDNKNFFLSSVSYGEDNGTHYELEFVRRILSIRPNGWKFEFKRWHIWKHFFKSHLFKDEEEIRLLFIMHDDIDERIKPEIKWIMDSTNKIVSRICLFLLNEDLFPLKLIGATVGPKCPELDCNVSQLNFMNSQTKTIKSSCLNSVYVSNIKDYR